MFMEFIYFSSFMISMNFPDQLAIDMSKPLIWVIDFSPFAA